MENVSKPIALIVGGSSGIGLATAEILINRGINTAIDFLIIDASSWAIWDVDGGVLAGRN